MCGQCPGPEGASTAGFWRWDLGRVRLGRARAPIRRRSQHSSRSPGPTEGRGSRRCGPLAIGGVVRAHRGVEAPWRLAPRFRRECHIRVGRLGRGPFLECAFGKARARVWAHGPSRWTGSPQSALRGLCRSACRSHGLERFRRARGGAARVGTSALLSGGAATR